jgi:hypothetical protein
MVHRWLVNKGWGMILFGLILYFVVGPIVYIFSPPSFFYIYHGGHLSREVLMLIIEYYRLSLGAGLGGIGIFFIIFGTMYFLATTILECMKKRRLAHRSKI